MQYFVLVAKEDDKNLRKKDKYFYVQGRDSLNFIITDAQYFNDVKSQTSALLCWCKFSI